VNPSARILGQLLLLFSLLLPPVLVFLAAAAAAGLQRTERRRFKSRENRRGNLIEEGKFGEFGEYFQILCFSYTLVLLGNPF
jgi:hypothetical protein